MTHSVTGTADGEDVVEERCGLSRPKKQEPPSTTQIIN